MRACSIKNCKTESYSACGISLYSLPKDPEMRMKWSQAMQPVKITKHTRVCARHFRKRDYTPESLRNRFRRLKPDAVPCIFPGMPEWHMFRKHYARAEQSDSDDEKTSPDDRFRDGMNLIIEKALNSLTNDKLMIIAPILKINRIEDVISAVVSNSTESNSFTASEQYNDIKDDAENLIANNSTASDLLNATEQCNDINKDYTKDPLADNFTPLDSFTATEHCNDINKDDAADPLAKKIKTDLEDVNNSPVDNDFDNSSSFQLFVHKPRTNNI